LRQSATVKTEPTGGLEVALAHGARLLASKPELAEDQAREILKVVPGRPEALLLLAAAQRRRGDLEAARAGLDQLVRARPDWPHARYELALTLLALGERKLAAKALEKTCELVPGYGDAWRALGDLRTLEGDIEGADKAYGRQILASVNDPELIAAATALCDNDIPTAERLLREFLKTRPTDVAAIRMLAEVAGRLGRYQDSENLLRRCLELAPGFAAARHNLAIVLQKRFRTKEAVEEIDRLLADDPQNPGYLNLKAAALAYLGDYAACLDIYASVLSRFPDQPKIWMSYGHALKTAGKLEEGVRAYRRSIDQEPSLGEAYWSLANLKTFRFDEAEERAMLEQLDKPGVSDEDRLHLDFALGKAFEDGGRYEESFDHYARGAALRRKLTPYSADEVSDHVAHCKALFTPEFFAERAGQGCDAADPIFIVGLPRSGSTLVEQILSSHSMVEGTQELQVIIGMARRLGRSRTWGAVSCYPDCVADLAPGELRALGEEFLEAAHVHRREGKPFFIDKMPNNFAHLGLIRVILPKAKIIDARRHPMAACFSGFKQHFAQGQNFSYDLVDIGRYWRDYAELMAHFDNVLPGWVHRVTYENMVADTESETRRLLEFCGLPFESACLRFWETERAVRTASSEQVRKPIFSDAVEHWRNYEAWLGPLKEALGPALKSYPAAPA
jgi:tetratricopeptide (TPR) repeat protein